MTRHERLATLARKMMLTANQAVALTETLTVAASKVGMSESQLVDACFDKPEVCEYLASICRKVTS